MLLPELFRRSKACESISLFCGPDYPKGRVEGEGRCLSKSGAALSYLIDQLDPFTSRKWNC